MVAAAAVVAVGKTVNLKTDIPHTMNKYSISQGLIKEIGPHFPSSMSEDHNDRNLAVGMSRVLSLAVVVAVMSQGLGVVLQVAIQ